MKKLCGVIFVSVLSACTASFAGPLVAYSTFQTASRTSNRFVIVNDHQQTIYNVTADTVKRVELRESYAVVQSSVNEVSLIHEGGGVRSSFYGSEFKISHGFFTAYTPHGLGKVFNLTGTELYSNPRNVEYVLIANDRFAVMDSALQLLVVYNHLGVELNRFAGVRKAWLSDHFLVTQSFAGAFSIYIDNESSPFVIDNSVEDFDVKISDEFAGYTRNGILRLFSHAGGGEIRYVGPIQSFSLTNSYALVKDGFGLTLYNKQGETALTAPTYQSYQVSHSLFAFVNTTGLLYVKNFDTGQEFSLLGVKEYSITDDLLLLKWGPLYRVYPLFERLFGNQMEPFQSFDHTFTEVRAGNGMVAFRSDYSTSANDNELKVYHLHSDGEWGWEKKLLIDVQRVDKVYLSVNREEWNWL